MATTDLLQDATLSTDPGREMRAGGAILFIGALLFVATIGFELMVGWHPSRGDTTSDIAAVILQLWPSLRRIWTAQGLAASFFALSALLLLQSRHLNGRWRPASILWSAVMIAGILITVSYGLTLGAYPPALSSLEGNPELFATVRGGVRFLYGTGLKVAGLGYFVLFIREAATRDGVVPRSWVLGIAVALVLSVMAAAVGLLRPRTPGAVLFFSVPALLGLALWRAGRQLPPPRHEFSGTGSSEMGEAITS